MRVGKQNKLKVKKGDDVIVITGRDKGLKGEVLRVFPKDRRVLVQGVNMMKRHQRQSMSNEGGIVAFEAPIHVSNIALVDPKSGAPTRVGYAKLGDGRKVRVAKRSNEHLDS